MSGRPAWLDRLNMPELSPEAFLLDASVRLLHTADDFAAFILQQRDEIRTDGLTGMKAAERYSDVFDAALQRMLILAVGSAGLPPGEEGSSGVAIVATGGYGRRELAPFSDVDVTFVPAREDDPGIDQVVRAFFRLMMDTARKAQLKVGYAYRLIAECASLELQTQTSLVDGRFVAGDFSLYCDFREELRRQINPARFVFDKAWERSAARDAAGGTVYRVEPDLKNGAGGLRDIQTAMWLAQVRFGVWSPAVWEELMDRGVVTYRQVEQLYEALEFLHTVRNALHWRARRQNDVLMMAQQGATAEALGFYGTQDRTPSQELMTRYFTHAERINLVAQHVGSWVLESRLELGDGLACARRRMECVAPEVFLSRPANVIRAFLLSQALGIDLSPNLEAMIRMAVEGPRALQFDSECGPLFLRLLESPERVASTLSRMAYTGALGWILPEFRPLMTLAPRNSAHEFTVGYHSLEVVRRLDEMRSDSPDTATGEAFSHLDYPATLFLAGLLHDVGKALPGQNHCDLGAALAPAVGIRLDMQPQEVGKVQKLVQNHLAMADVARYRDLTREDSIKELIAVTPDQESLDELFLLTAADTRSVAAGIWTPLQNRYLEELYHRATNLLARPQTDTGEVEIQRYQRKITMALTQHNVAPDDVAQHVELMPASYLLNTPSAIMALHIEMVRKVLSDHKAVIGFRDDRAGQFTELIVCAFDDPRPGLLSKIAGCLWSSDVSVHSAQVFTRRGEPGIAIDTLWVDFHGHTLEPQRKRRVEIDLIAVLSGETGVRDLLVSRGKGSDLDASLHEPEVRAHRSEDHVICEVRAGDQRGMLYRLTRAISELGWDIHSARISSGSARSRDIFYISEPGGITGSKAAELLYERLSAPGPPDTEIAATPGVGGS